METTGTYSSSATDTRTVLIPDPKIYSNDTFDVGQIFTQNKFDKWSVSQLKEKSIEKKTELFILPVPEAVTVSVHNEYLFSS